MANILLEHLLHLGKCSGLLTSYQTSICFWIISVFLADVSERPNFGLSRLSLSTPSSPSPLTLVIQGFFVFFCWTRRIMQVLVIVCYNRKWFVQNGPTKFPHCSRNLLLVPIFTEESPPCYLVCCYIFLKCFRKSESLVSLLDFPIMSFVVLIPLSWAYVWLILDPYRAHQSVKCSKKRVNTNAVVFRELDYQKSHQKIWNVNDVSRKSSESLEMSRFSGEVSGKIIRKPRNVQIFWRGFRESRQKIRNPQIFWRLSWEITRNLGCCMFWRFFWKSFHFIT